ncbi:glutamine synthetase family protein [Novisyntrophococcus fermenticellae]|uniref:glutamine synthetase family protein n=1 Tax=Novisyntrophococcus fermenticellae TaxID=2068655 RepID=UPI001E3BF3F4|nr:glutamine synthetase family protein [Novisyntrophococcus fermenticellae]
MARYTKEMILQMAKEEDVEFIRLQFTDMSGTLRNMAVTSSQLEKALDNECIFDASTLDGFSGEDENELYLYPDLDSFAILPWRPQQGKVARMICDIYQPDGTFYPECSRGILKRVLEEAKSMGYQFVAGPECEFFLFHTEEDGTPTTLTHDRAGYFDLGPLDLGENARRDMVLTLEDMGFEVESSYHEVSPGQHEIDFHHCKGLEAADSLMTFKFAVRTIAKRHGLHATFMPKPVTDSNGSGLHVNCILRDELGKNLFFDESDEKGLSKTAYYFMGGILKHIQGMSLITNPLVNSYKRLVPGYEAPVFVGWATKSKSQIIRIPAARGNRTKIELRSPDASANPYLVLAAILAAGLDGIRNKMMPPACMEENLNNLSLKENPETGIETLPGNLQQAIQAFEEDAFVQNVLGEDFSRRYIEMKKAEWKEYIQQVSDWEISKYLYRI